MIPKTLNSKLYSLSQTLFGGERFKLIIDMLKAIEESEKEFSIYDLPNINRTFKTEEERQDYEKVKKYFFAVNLALVAKLDELFSRCLIAYCLIIHAVNEDEARKEIKDYFKIAVKYFAIVKIIKELEIELKYNFLAYSNDQKIKMQSELLENFYDNFSIVVEPCSSLKNLPQEELEEVYKFLRLAIGCF